MPSRTSALFALSVLLAAAAHGQTAYLVHDIDQGEALVPSLPAFVDSLTVIGRKVFFLGRTTANDLWVGASDGTSAGTQLLAEAVSFYGFPVQLYGLRGLSLWVGVDHGGIARLWRSDGTRAGTYVLTGPASDLAAGVYGAALDGRFYFFGCTEAGGCGLWATDGTQAGTAAVAALDIPPLSVPALVAAGHTVYLATDSALWASDGTAAGTRRVAAFPPSALSRLTAAAGRVFFAVDSSDLWTSDGTAAGTLRLAHTSGAIRGIQPFGDHVDFPVDLGSYSDQLWRSDGTPAGTVEIAPSFIASRSSLYQPYDVAEVGGRVVYYGLDASFHASFFATDAARGSTVVLKKDVGSLANRGVVRAGGRALFGVETATTQEIWTTDGTAAGTRRLVDPCAGAPCSVREPRPLGDGAFFVSHPATAAPGQPVQCALWRSDGTASGTVRFASFPCPAFFSGESAAAALGGQVLFPAGEVNALWISDGTAAGTRPLSAHPDASAQPRQLLGSGDTVFFVTGPITDPELWSSAGADASTARLAAASDLAADAPPPIMTRTAHGLVASLDRRRLLGSDGTPGGTSTIADFGSSQVAGLAALGGEAFFPVKTGDRNQLWKSDGTAAGTVAVGDLPANVVQPSDWTAVESTIYFLDDAPGFEPALWATDGTLAGTRRLYTFAGGAVRPLFTRAGSAVYFVADDRLHGGSQVWKTDGTPQGTTLVHAVDEPIGYYPWGLGELAGNLYFLAVHGPSGQDRLGLFRSDGTDAGTTLVKDLEGNPDPTRLPRPVALGGALFFALDDTGGRRLWKTDGTAAGTVLMHDVFPGDPGAQGALPTLAAAGGRLYFAADDGAHGLELWESDGTAAGTRLLQDISPGAPGSAPGELTLAGDRLYFAADDGVHGRELWALPVAATGCQPAPDHLCLQAGRFRVDADWRDFQGHAGRGTAVALTGDTGYFWFFSPSNVEVVAKVLDGRGVNQAFWVFYGALSSVEYTLSVTDTETGLTRRYFNPSGVLASVGDTDGFGPLGAASTYRPKAVPQGLALVSARTDPRAATAGCAADAGRLCLAGGRFALTAAWKDFQGHAGSGTAVGLTGDTGYFWFFDPGNVEVVAKVLDGRSLNGKFWLFYGALSSVEYTLTVTDTQTGAVRMYRNLSGHLASQADTSAF